MLNHVKTLFFFSYFSFFTHQSREKADLCLSHILLSVLHFLGYLEVSTDNFGWQSDCKPASQALSESPFWIMTTPSQSSLEGKVWDKGEMSIGLNISLIMMRNSAQKFKNKIIWGLCSATPKSQTLKRMWGFELSWVRSTLDHLFPRGHTPGHMECL